jgi:hypothetical protein
MAEVGITVSAKDDTGPVFDKVVSNYDRVRAAATSAMDKISSAAGYLDDKITAVYDSAHTHFGALPEVLTAGMIGAIGNVIVQMGLLPGVIGTAAAKIFSGGGAISTGMESASTSMIGALGIKISSAVEKTIGTISAAAGGAILSMLSAVAVVAIVALFASAIKETLAWTESVSALSKQLQMSSESASTYKIVLDEQKVSADSFATANTQLIDTLNNNETAISDMGIATRTATGELRSTADLLPEVNTKLLGMTDKTAQNAKALEIYSSKWSDLTGVMKINTKTVADATDQAKGLGLVVGKDNVDAAAKYQTALATLEIVTKSLMISTGQGLLPVFADFYKVLAAGATVIIPILGTGLQVLGAIAKEIGLDFGLLLITADTAGRALYNLATGNLDAAKQNLSNYKDALKDFYVQVKALATNQPDPTKPVTQDVVPDAQKIARSMQLELQALKQQNQDKAALYKADSAIQLIILKSTYDAGQMTTAAYYDAVSNQAEDAARKEITSAQDYLTATQAVVLKIKDLKGSASDEYKASLNAETQAQQAVSMAQLALGKTMVEDSIKTTEALKARQDEYSKLSIQLLTDTGQYVAAEEKKQEMDQRSTDFLRLKKEAVSNVTAAVQALADREQSAPLAAIAELQKEDAVRRQYADNYRSIQDKIATDNGKNTNVIQAESAVQDALNQKKAYENQLVVAKQSGVLADYSAAVQMIAAWDVHINQLTLALDLTRRKANLDALGNADQIIANDMIAKGLDQEAFWLQKQIDQRNLTSQIQQDQLKYEQQITQAIKDGDTELQNRLILAKDIINQKNIDAGYAISDRAWIPAATMTGPSSGAGSLIGSSSPYVLGGLINNITAPFMGGLATGGYARPNTTYQVNEDGTEYLTMGSKGGYITPTGKTPPGQNNQTPITTISIGDVHFTLPNVTNGSTAEKLTAQAADLLALQLIPSLKKYQSRCMTG